MAYSNYVEPPQAVTGGSSPWNRQSRDDIATGLHSVEQWPSTPATPYHRASGSVEVDATAASNALPEWLVQYILEFVAARPDTTPEQRDQIAEKLLGRYYPQTSQPCSCNGQHPRATSGSASGCIGCRMRNASKSMLGSIRRTLSTAAKMRKCIRMPRRNSAGRQQAPQALYRWSDPISPAGPDGYGKSCNPSTNEKYQPGSGSQAIGLADYPSGAELPSDSLCELQGSVPGSVFAGAMPSPGMFNLNTTQQTHMSYPSPPSQNAYERSHSGHSASSGMTSDRSVSMMSDWSAAIRGAPSLVSNWSQSTMSSGLTAISTNNVPRFDSDKDLVDSPVGIEGTGAAELPPWREETGRSRQVSWNSTSTAVDSAWPGVERAPEPAEWFRTAPPSTPDTFPITAGGFLDESDGSAQPPPPYSSIEMAWGAEPPAYSSPPQAQMALGFASPGNPLVFPGVSQALLVQAPSYQPLVHHSMHFPPPPTPSQGRPQLFQKRNMPLRRTTTYGAIIKQPSVAMRPNASAARGLSANAEIFFQPSFQPPPSSPDLPSVRKAKVQRATSLRRRSNQPGPRPRRPKPKPKPRPRPPRAQTPESIWCKACNYRPEAPQLGKKMRRHMETDGHRQKTNQPLVKRMPCGHVGDDGVPCDKKYSRLDNLKAHQQLHESADAALSEEEEDEDDMPESDNLGELNGELDLERSGDLDGLGSDENWEFLLTN